MMQWPVTPKSFKALQEEANPPSGQGVSEAIPWVWFDTLTYTSGTTTQLRFFQSTRATTQLSNMPLSGQIQAPQFFEPWFLGLDVLSPPQATALSAWLDVWQILLGTGTAGQGGPTATLLLSQKEYLVLPVSYMHGSGGPTGFGWSEASNAATGGAEYANNSIPDGGFPIAGALTIPPTVSFGVVIDWPAALTLSADRDLRLNLVGTLHRKVL